MTAARRKRGVKSYDAERIRGTDESPRSAAARECESARGDNGLMRDGFRHPGVDDRERGRHVTRRTESS